MKKYSGNTSDMNRYDDLLNLPPHKSSSRTPMSLADRAAQFSPFAALTGYETAIKETARLTDQKIILDETAKSRLDETLSKLQSSIQNRIATEVEIEVCYFEEDKHKAGGRYITERGIVKKIDTYERTLIFTTGLTIDIEDIIEITGDFEEDMI